MRSAMRCAVPLTWTTVTNRTSSGSRTSAFCPWTPVCFRSTPALRQSGPIGRSSPHQLIKHPAAAFRAAPCPSVLFPRSLSNALRGIGTDERPHPVEFATVNREPVLRIGHPSGNWLPEQWPAGKKRTALSRSRSLAPGVHSPGAGRRYYNRAQLSGGGIMMLERRALLKFLGASPLFTALAPWTHALAEEHLPASAAEALDVFDLEAVAQRLVPPAHWGYLQSGVDGDVTLKANHAAYGRYELRPRRLVDVSHVDLSTEVFGIKAASPIGCWPIGSLRALNPEGDIAVARATKKKNQLQIMSTQASFPVEEINAARGAPVWYQLYTTNQFQVTKMLVKRAEAAGCPVVAVTVDTPAGRNTETATRLRREDTRTCSSCHAVDARGNPRPNMSLKPMFGGIDTRC